jgi:hypothetical protein
MHITTIPETSTREADIEDFVPLYLCVLSLTAKSFLGLENGKKSYNTYNKTLGYYSEMTHPVS